MIVNPRSGGGSTGRRWTAVEGRLRQALGPFEQEPTRGPRDAERIAREAVRAGVDRLVVAGGDGTLKEVVSGLLAAGVGSYAEIGVLPLGTGGDFLRTLGVPRQLDEAIACLAAGKPRTVDAGRVRCLDPSGRQTELHFVNVASLGLGGLVVRLVNEAPKFLGGTLSFLLGTLRGIARHRCLPVTLRVDGETLFQGPLVLAAAGNGRYFGGGMQVAPGARLDDGLFDVVVVEQVSKLSLLRRFPRIYRGAHLDDPAVRFRRGRVLEADALPGTVPLEVDGEVAGSLPARLEVLPGALTLIGPPA